MNSLKILFLLLITCLYSSHSDGQSFFKSDSVFNKNRTIGVSITDGVLWAGSISALQFVWYDDFAKTDFHIFNDWNEWQQMDKAGHLLTSWNFSRAAGDLFEWSGINHKHASLLGAAYSIGYMSTFELLDAFNADWGFSWSDVAFNSGGSLLYFGQEFFFNQQYVKLKFSCHLTDLSVLRPQVLGDSFLSRVFKDYNGQTYWMSFNPLNFFSQQKGVLPWLNLSFGYGIHDQLFGDGSVFITGDPGATTTFVPYRQYFFSLDIDFEKIPVSKPWLKFVFRSLNVFKVPFPALEFSSQGIRLRAIYF